MHGEKRKNAGRPKGRNQYGESTTPIHIPLSKVSAIKAQLKHGPPSIPFYASKIPAVFPEPGEDCIISDVNNIFTCFISSNYW